MNKFKLSIYRIRNIIEWPFYLIACGIDLISGFFDDYDDWKLGK